MCFIVYDIKRYVYWCRILDPFWDKKKLIDEFCYDQLNVKTDDCSMKEVQEWLLKEYKIKFGVYYCNCIMGR